MSHRGELAAPIFSRSFESPIKLQQHLLPPVPKRVKVDDDEPLLALEKKVQKLTESIFYQPPEKSGDVGFVSFSDRKGMFHYQELYNWCLIYIRSFQDAVEYQQFEGFIETQKLVDGSLKEVTESVFLSVFHAPTRMFIEKHLQNLKESLELLKKNQDDSESKFCSMFDSLIKQITRLEGIKWEASDTADLRRQKTELTGLKSQACRAIHATPFGLLAQHEIVKKREEELPMFTHALKVLQSEQDKSVLRPSLLELNKWTLQISPGDFLVEILTIPGDFSVQVLAEFYKGYSEFLGFHRAYFSRAITAHIKLQEEADELLAKIEMDLILIEKLTTIKKTAVSGNTRHGGSVLCDEKIPSFLAELPFLV